MRSLPRDRSDQLFRALERRGHECIGPVVRDGAIVYDRIRSSAELPRGWTDEQAPGRYRLVRRDDDALFGYVVGPHSWKKYLNPPQERLWRIGRDGVPRVSARDAAPPAKLAFIGVRACEIAAIEIQDRVFTGGAFVDEGYRTRRRDSFIVAVNCTQSAATCFCASMRTGPEVRAGYDIMLTEVIDGDHAFLIEAGSDLGREVLAELDTVDPRESQTARAAEGIRAAAASQTREIGDGVRELLRRNLESPQWEEVAERCLSCANCTMACPTCFCSSVHDTSDLSGDHAERWRRWDSCFNPDFSALHGGEVRRSTASRYRQWMTHKLSTWFDQFGSSGCVGCGRCITWCPVGIDITAEVRTMREQEAS